MTEKKPEPQGFACPSPHNNQATIQLAHGAGGRASEKLLRDILLSNFTDPELARLGDAALLDTGGKICLTTDSFVIDPIFFPGGDIGKLAVCGTVNDLAVSGAEPLYLTCSLIIEEGFAIDQLRAVIESMAATAKAAGVRIVAGDTKVVERGKGDKLFINTAGVGRPLIDPLPAADRIKPGDMIIISGGLAEHGISILSVREGLAFKTPIVSDCATLNHLTGALVEKFGAEIAAMRDPTRGGAAATLNEWARASNIGITIDEKRLPIAPAVRGACELLGLDPLLIANEGKVMIAVRAEKAEAILSALRAEPLGKNAAIIGRATDQSPGMVTGITPIGGRRIIDTPLGEQLPRIC